MHIRHIDIKNYRGIEKLQMEFHEGINLLIGNNGAGKTSLLNAVSVAIRLPLCMMHGTGITANIPDDEIYQTKSEMGDATEQTVLHYPASIEGDIVWQGREYGYCIKKENAAKSSFVDNYDISRAFLDNFGESSQLFPLLCFQRAGRGTIIKQPQGTVTISTNKPQRVQGYKDAFNEKLMIGDIQQWCIQMEFSEFQKKAPLHEYKEFQLIVSQFLSYIEDESSKHSLYYSPSAGTLVYDDGIKETPLYLKSDGYQSILCMALELAYRAVLLNPSIDHIASVITGTVLIDEIEMHLHPAWQWKILEALKKTFPKVQFIIATHSPIILSSAKDASLFLMKSPNEVTELDSAYGYSVNNVLMIPQNTDWQPSEIEKYYKKIEDILDHGTEEELNHLLQEAQEEFGSSSTALKGIKDFIEVNHWVEEA